MCVCMYAHMYIHVTIKEESMHLGGDTGKVGGVQHVDTLLIHELLKKENYQINFFVIIFYKI